MCSSGWVVGQSHAKMRMAAWRLIACGHMFSGCWIQFYIMYLRGIYCKMRKDTELTLNFLGDLRFNCLSFIAMIALSYIPYNEELLDVVLGRELTARGTFTVFLFGVLQFIANFVALPSAEPVRCAVDTSEKMCKTQKGDSAPMPVTVCGGIAQIEEEVLDEHRVRRRLRTSCLVVDGIGKQASSSLNWPVSVRDKNRMTKSNLPRQLSLMMLM